MPPRTRSRDRNRHRLGVPDSWHVAVPDVAWWYPGEHNTVVAKVVVPPRERPSATGGRWLVDELWTVTLPWGDDGSQAYTGDPVAMLEDKPWRVTWWSKKHPLYRVVSRVTLCCGLCGRSYSQVNMGSANGVLLCHTPWVNATGRQYQTDCYRLVTVYGLPLGSRVR